MEMQRQGDKRGRLRTQPSSPVDPSKGSEGLMFPARRPDQKLGQESCGQSWEQVPEPEPRACGDEE